MKAVLSDTFYWAALTSTADGAHERAMNLSRSLALEILRISMQTMRRERLTEVLTDDRHFEREGFRALFRGM